jgi:hypothetical protein
MAGGGAGRPRGDHYLPRHRSRRRLTCVAALTEVTVLGISTLVLALTSGGWYVYYVFELEMFRGNARMSA